MKRNPYEVSTYKGDNIYHIDTTGDACVGDEVKFEMATFTGSHSKPKFNGFVLVEAKIINDSYGKDKQQHTFTLLHKDGTKQLIKGRNLYRNGLFRKPWKDENERNKTLEEKHLRGSIARSDKYERKNNPSKDRLMKSSKELKTGIIIKSFDRTFHNADYWRDTSNDRYIDNHEEAMALAKKGREVIGVHSHLLISDSYGIYIPQKFCENFDLNTWGLSESDKDVDVCLAGPDEEWYWEAWNTILDNAKHIDADGCEWHLEQDGDLFTVHYSEYEGEEDEDVRSNPRPRKFKDIFVIVGHSSYGKEDIDQFDTLQEARKMLIEYRMAMPTFALKIVKRKEPLEVKSNPSDEIDEIAVREIYLTITNEGEFYSNYLLPLYRASEKFYKKGQYDSKKFVNALQKGINDFTLHGPLHFYYHRKFYSMIPKAEREEIAKMIERDFLNEIAVGNSYLP
jgi:hypothetical protein